MIETPIWEEGDWGSQMWDIVGNCRLEVYNVRYRGLGLKNDGFWKLW